ncbi:S1 domain-containing RNA-binding protein [Lacticigenium naphthae]|uniref:S1 domain-containing RNA-binding protein n=1 Tax=Lacticigenium naphthae TaxID=515351 RepID=UPI0004043A8A|nr:S1 domain-containing RNA-binding protein [Lacticigenium naphthae]
MSIEIGNKVEGKITGITNFGAFVDLGEGKTGLVHISEVSDRYIKDINEELEVGQVITVKVLSIGDDGKIGLSIRKAEDKPAEAAPSKPRATTTDRGKSGSSYRPASRPSQGNRSSGGNKKEDFDSLMSSFLKDSEDRLTSLKRSTENKRGGRGGRRD